MSLEKRIVFAWQPKAQLHATDVGETVAYHAAEAESSPPTGSDIKELQAFFDAVERGLSG